MIESQNDLSINVSSLESVLDEITETSHSFILKLDENSENEIKLHTQLLNKYVIRLVEKIANKKIKEVIDLLNSKSEQKFLKSDLKIQI